MGHTEISNMTKFLNFDDKFAKIDFNFADLKAHLDVKFSRLDAQFSKFKFELISWILGISIVQKAVIVLLVKFIP